VRISIAIILFLAVIGTPVAAGEPSLPDDDRSHWAFQKPQHLTPPAVRGRDWVRNPLDAFILAHLEQAGLQPAPPAERAALLRRVTLDLIGLPPTPQETEAFVRDSWPDAYERVVERLLASPHHGERWAQHWLDVVRYAESNGYEADKERPHAWCYRDYVARSFNEDKPYDRFVTEQLAGDLLARTAVKEGIKSPEQLEAGLLVAAGLHRCGPVHLTSGNLDPAVGRQEVLTEMANGVGAAFLGLTIGCARCHDHKFDPISQADYYRLQTFFSTVEPKEIDIASAGERAEYQRQVRDLELKLAPFRIELAAIDAPYRARLTEAKKARLEPIYREALAVDAKKRTPEQKKLAANAQTLLKVTWDEVVAALTPEDRAHRIKVRQRLHELNAQRPAPPAQAWTVADSGGVPGGHILRRGDPHNKGAAVGAGVPRVLRLTDEGQLSSPPSRLDLARWLISPDHPLTARVIVNRLWQHHFGQALVATPNDFGLRGEAPSHPQLLDWLATELVRQGWSLKQLHRLMVLSNTYRQDSRASNPQARKVDPDNRFLWRFNRQRLEGEALRDSILAVAGTLNRRVGGPMVRIPLEPEVYDLIFTEDEPDGLWPVTPDVREHSRRSLYLYTKRNVRLPLLEAFDQPDTLSSCALRPVSTFAPQALILLNSPFMQLQSKAFAVRLTREAGPGAGEWVEHAYRLALGRLPRPVEMQMAQEFLEQQAEQLRDRLRARQPVGVPPGWPEEMDPALGAALADFCLALLNRNEFLYAP